MPSVHFDAKLNRRFGDESTAPAHGIRQPGSRTSPKVTDTVPRDTADLEECAGSITPSCLRTLYGLSYNPVATDKNSFGIGQCILHFYRCICYNLMRDLLVCSIAEYSNSWYLPSDLEMFAGNYSTDLIGKEPVVVSIDGGEIFFLNCGAHRC